jgi:hypothetical protein
MVPLFWRWLRPVLVGSMVALLVALPAFSMAAAARSSGAGNIKGDVSATGTHFLYVDTGGGSIDGYKVTRRGLIPTPGSPYPTGNDNDAYNAFGANQIATFSGSSGKQFCVFHTDTGSIFGQGTVESFTVNHSTGALTKVTIMRAGQMGNYYPGDIHVSTDGNYVYVAISNALEELSSFLDVFTVGSDCSLSLASSLYSATANYVSIALLGATQLMAVDNWNGAIDIYQITNGIQLTLRTSTLSQLPGPSGAAAMPISSNSLVFNGINRRSPSQLEAHTVSSQGTLGNVRGSPQTDLQGSDGAYVFFDQSHQHVIESEGDSHTLGVYGLSQEKRKESGGYQLAFLGQAKLPGAHFLAPAAMTELSSELFVVVAGYYSGYRGAVDACAIASGSLTCPFTMVLPNFTTPNGIGVL